MKVQLKLFFPVLLLLTSCSPDIYKDKAFFAQAKPAIQSLAVLPVEVLYTGNLPKNWSSEHIAKLETDQSSQLQQGIYEDFLFHTSGKRKRNKWPVSMMDLHVINSKLAKNGISLQESWKMPSDELAKILGADMLVRTRVQNVRYMSEVAAAGINIGASIIEDILNKSGSSVYGPRVRAGESSIDLSLYHFSKSVAVARISGRQEPRVKRLPVYVKN